MGFFKGFKNFISRRGMQLVAAALILGVFAVAAANMGDILEGIRGGMVEEPSESREPAKVSPKTEPKSELATPKEQTEASSGAREPLSSDEEPLPMADEPEAAELLPSPAEQQVFSADFVPVYIRPVSGEVTKEFSGNTLVRSETMEDWRTHNGTDIACAEGETALAIQSGKVEYMMQEDLWGYVVELRLDSGIHLRYCGLEAPAEGLVVGARLSQGEPVGTVGSAMLELAEGPHLHVEAIRNGEYIDPRELFG